MGIVSGDCRSIDSLEVDYCFCPFMFIRPFRWNEGSALHAKKGWKATR